MLIIVLLALLLPTVAPSPKVPVTPVMNYVPDLPPTYSITYQFLFYNET